MPVNMPTSSTVLALFSLASVAMKRPSSAPAQHSRFCRNCVLPCKAPEASIVLLQMAAGVLACCSAEAWGSAHHQHPIHAHQGAKHVQQ